MVGDDHVHAARVGVIDGSMSGNAGIAGEDQGSAILDDRLERLDVNAVTLSAADGDVVHKVRIQRPQCLYQQGRGRLPIHVEIAPDADPLPGMDSLLDPFHGRFDTGEGDGCEQFRVQEGAGLPGTRDAAPDESLRDEWVQAEVRERGRNIHWRGIQPKSHLRHYNG